MTPLLAQAEPVNPKLLETLGSGLVEAFAFEHILLLVAQLAFLYLALRVYDWWADRLQHWKVPLGATMKSWLPTVRLVSGGVAGLVIVRAVTPDIPAARALVVLAVVTAVLWSGRVVLRNAAAGAILIARRAVTVGEFVEVGDHSGRVRSVTLRGVELEGEDGSRIWVPGVLFHTDHVRYAPGRAHAMPVTVERPIPPEARHRLEAIRSLARQMAQLSPRRAPGTPVLVTLDDRAWRLGVTMTPYDRAEAEALRVELTQRLEDAVAG